MPKKFKFRYVNEIVGGFVLLVVLLLLAGVLVAGHAQHWFESVYEINLNFPPEGSMDLQKGGSDAAGRQGRQRAGHHRGRRWGHHGFHPGARAFRQTVRAGGFHRAGQAEDGGDGRRLHRTDPRHGAELPRSGGEIECVKDTEIMQMLEEALEQLRQEATNTLALVNAAISEYTKLAAGMNDPQGNLQLTMANVNGLLEDIRKGPGLPAKILNDPAMAKDVEGIMAQVQELLQKVNAMAAELQVVVAKLPAMVDTVAGEVDNLPVVVGETQTLMRESITLLDGLQKHWLLRKYVESDDALRSEEVLVP